MLLLLADENFPLKSVKHLRQIGFDIKHISGELASIKDHEVIEIAIEEDRLILTFDSDFGELIFKLGYRPKGVIYLRLKSYRPEEPGQILEQIFKNQQLEFTGFLTVIDRDKIRQRKIG
jgi:predicted nuclease of predicted toxin-antitoxin system